MIIVKDVNIDSDAYVNGLRAKDRILKINGEEAVDYLDIMFNRGSDELILEVSGKGVVKADPEDPGFEADDFQIRGCANGCLFCFVNQLPKGMRPSLYIKDDDYRMSFLYGSYITLSNMSDKDFERIGRMHLSPLYLSVHAVDEAVRRRLMSCPHGEEIRGLIGRLISMGIRLHTQIVVVPGYNDGRVLGETLDYLTSLYPHVLSVTVVPVGLTDYRTGQADLRRLNAVEALSVLDMIGIISEKQIEEHGEKTVFATDEMYLSAGVTPPLETYPDLYDNGVGMYGQFMEDLDYFESAGVFKKLDKKLSACIITSVDGGRILEDIVTRLSPYVKRLDKKTVKNSFFGFSVTVTGLLTGSDIITEIKNIGGEYDRLLVPDVVFNGDGVTLDGFSKSEIEESDSRVMIVYTEVRGLLEGLK